MIRRFGKPVALATVLILAVTSLARSQKDTPAAKASTETAAAVDPGLGAVTKAYEDGFNSHDAAAIGKLWMENGVHTDRETGERTLGRAAIQRDLDETFKTVPDIRISVEPGEVRMIQPNVAHVEGTTTTFIPDEDPASASFIAILVKQGDAWLLDSVEELETPAPETSHDALKVLEFLIGEWADEGDEGKSTSSFRWSTNGSFLIRSFTTNLSDEIQSEGTQVIGWDPRSKEIRSWTFNSDGSFGEATWARSGADWLIKSTQTLADGGAASGTYVITPTGQDSMTVKLIGHEVDGEPIPAVEPVTVVRLPEPETAADQTEAVPAAGDAAKGGDK